MTDAQKINTILDFISIAEHLKIELRHSWTSNVNRQESVAEHTWLMSLLAMLLLPEMQASLDPLKVLKMVITHDLVEIFAGDVPVHEESHRQANKHQTEKAALEKLVALLPNKALGQEITNLWEEFEAGRTDEGRFVKALDTLEVVTQHYNTSLTTWDDKDFDWALSAIQDCHFHFDPFLRMLKDRINDITVAKIENAGQLDRMNQENLEKWKNGIPLSVEQFTR